MTEFERRLNETFTWYREHRRDGRGVVEHLQFLTRVNDHLMFLLFLASEELRRAQGRPASSHLWMPTELRTNEPIRV